MVLDHTRMHVYTVNCSQLYLHIQSMVRTSPAAEDGSSYQRCWFMNPTGFYTYLTWHKMQLFLFLAFVMKQQWTSFSFTTCCLLVLPSAHLPNKPGSSSSLSLSRTKLQHFLVAEVSKHERDQLSRFLISQVISDI